MWCKGVMWGLNCVQRFFSITLCFPGLAGDCESISELPAGDGVQNWGFSSLLLTRQFHWHLSSNTRFYWTVFSLASKPLIGQNVHSTQSHPIQSLFKHTTPQTYRTHRDCTTGKKNLCAVGTSHFVTLCSIDRVKPSIWWFPIQRSLWFALRSSSQMGLEAEGGP